MSIQIGQVLQSVGLPKDDVSLFSTGSNKSVLGRVHKAVDSFLMEIKGTSWLISESL